MEDYTHTTNSADDIDKLERLLRLKESEKQQRWNTQVPIYMALLGLAFSAINMYTTFMTRITNLETKLEYITQLVTELKADVKEMGKK